MKHLAKRAFSLLLAALMVLSLIPATTPHVHAQADIELVYGFDADGGALNSGLAMLTNSSHGTSLKQEYLTIAINKGKTLVMGLTEAARNKFTQAEGYDGNVLLEVEYYLGSKLPTYTSISIAQNLTVKYHRGNGFSEATLVETKAGIENTTAIAVYALNGTYLNLESYSGLSNAAFSIVNNDGDNYLCVRSIRLIDPDSAPVFVTNDYPAAFYDNQEFEDIKVGNAYRDKNIRVTGTVLIDGQATNITNSKIFEGALAKRTSSLSVITKENLKSALMNNGAYQEGTYTLNVKMIWDTVTNEVLKTYTFTRKNTIRNELSVVDNNVLYTATKLDAEHAPNKYGITISGGDLTESITVNITDSLVFDENGVAQLNLTADQNLAAGKYTVKVETFYDDVQRTTNAIEFEKIETTPETTPCEHNWADATCAAPKTCSVCGATEGTALEHDMQLTTAEVPAKCGEAGTTAVYTCANGCGTVTGGEEIKALEHDMQQTAAEVPAKCGEAGTTAVYTCANGCGTVTGGEEIKALEHAFDNDQDGTCNRCGFVRIVHAGSNVDLNNDLDVNIYVSLDETKIEEYTASISKGGQVVVEDAALVKNGDNVFQVTLPGVPAKELCEEITVTVRDSEGNEVITIVDSFAKYAQRALASESVSKEAKTMIVDMLNYAAAAQEHFGYKDTELVNAGLTAEQQALGTKNDPEVTNKYVKSNNYYYGTNFNLENNITMNMYVAGLGDEGYGIIKYTDHTGEAKEITIYAANCQMSGSYYVFTIEEFVTADCACSEVYAEFYTGENELVVTVTDSMESYVARGAATHPWLYKMMKFVNSTLAYMNSK